MYREETSGTFRPNRGRTSKLLIATCLFERDHPQASALDTPTAPLLPRLFDRHACWEIPRHLLERQHGNKSIFSLNCFLKDSKFRVMALGIENFLYVCDFK
ncbi:hypothetical protein BgiMline_027522 [Biomphalaria glabrata]